MKRILALMLLVFISQSVHAAPVVVAATSWAAALARAAGAEHVMVIAPENLQHPADYDPKPSDLLLLRDAQFIVLGGFEGFAHRLREATGSKAKVVQVHLDNSLESIGTEVLRLGELFGTQDNAQIFLQNFTKEYMQLRQEVRTALQKNGKQAVAHKFMATWAEFAGLELVGTFGPDLVQPGHVLRLSALRPDFVLDNGHLPGGAPVAEAAGARLVTLINFPGPGMDLLDVLKMNAHTFIEAAQE